MHENEMNSRLDRHFCKAIYSEKELYESLFDLKKSRNTKLSSRFYALQLSKLECFVDDLVSNDEIPFVPYLGNGGKKEYAPTSLARRYFQSMPDFFDIGNMLSPRYNYSERVDAFFKCCRSMGLLSEQLKWNKIDVDSKITYPRFGGASAAEIFNTLVASIRREWKINKIQAKVNARKKEASDRYDDYCQYVDSLFDNSARLVVLRVDLFYKKQYSNGMNVSGIKNDLNHLLENKRCNSIFRSLKGYIAKLEYGIVKGVHWHVIFFFDGSKRNGYSHIHLAEEIGEYWVRGITKGRGDYWNVNDKANHYDKLGRRGIGVINWDDTDLRRNLNYFVLGYLCKMDQFIRPKFGPNVRLFRRGNFPKIPTIKPGRSRKVLESHTERSQIA